MPRIHGDICVAASAGCTSSLASASGAQVVISLLPLLVLVALAMLLHVLALGAAVARRRP
jgi:hypothetical protein